MNITPLLNILINDYESLQKKILILFNNNTLANNKALYKWVEHFDALVDYVYKSIKNYNKLVKDKCISNIDVFKANSQGLVSSQMDGYF